jgi:prepilin-type N-terminal cleavage/methylation domain-containing protein
MLIRKEKQRNTPNASRGFTLVELLIVIAIVSIMTAISMLGISKNRNTSKVEIAANQVVATLRSLQNDSINGKVISNQSICRIKFDVADKAKQYNASYYDCNGSYDTLIDSGTFYLTSSGDSSNVTSSAASFFFTAPRGDISSSGSIMLTSGSDIYYVCVSLSGNIYAQKSGCP